MSVATVKPTKAKTGAVSEIAPVKPANDAPTFEWIGVSDIFSAPIEPAKWVVPGMEIGPGRPCGVWGLGGGGKSWDVMEIGVAVATGSRAFGHFDVTKGPVSHVSHELGLRAVRERYRRLANGRGMLLEDFGENLRIACLPRLFLNSPGAETEYLRHFEKTSLVIIDSLRRALPGENENDSEMSNFLDILNRVSEKTGATFLVVHHCGKGEFEDKRLTGRGSTAIMDGSGCVWLLEGSGKGPRRMTQIRAHDDGDGECSAFYVAMERIGVPDPVFVANRGPVRLTYENEDSVSERLVDAAARQHSKKNERAERLILQTVRDQPGINKGDLESLVAATKLMSSRPARALIDTLIDREWLIVTTGKKNAQCITLNPVR